MYGGTRLLETMPFDSPLWYIRDLMMVLCFLPLLYQAIKRVGWVFPGILVLLKS